MTRPQCRARGLKKSKAGRGKAPTTTSLSTGGGKAKLPAHGSTVIKPTAPKESGPDPSLPAAGEGSDTSFSDFSLQVFREREKTDPVIAAMLTKKDNLKDAVNANKSPGSRLDCYRR